MNTDYQSFIAAISAFQSTLEKMNADLTAAYSPIIQSTSQMQYILETLMIPIREIQRSMSLSIANTIANSLAVNNSVIQDMTKDIQNNLVDFSSHISTDFASMLENISFQQEYVEVPECLCSFTAHDNEYPQEVPITTEPSLPKRRITLEFFLSCILPNIIALFGVWLTIYYHHIDASSQNASAEAEAAMFEDYTESLNRLSASVSALNDYLSSQSKLSPDSHLTAATNSNAVPAVTESDYESVGESESHDMPQQPD